MRSNRSGQFLGGGEGCHGSRLTSGNRDQAAATRNDR
jgi:hypothetical protein